MNIDIYRYTFFFSDYVNILLPILLIEFKLSQKTGYYMKTIHIYPPNYSKMSVIAHDRCVIKMEDPKCDWNFCEIIGIIGSRGN